jgi:hypothetical protein
MKTMKKSVLYVVLFGCSIVFLTICAQLCHAACSCPGKGFEWDGKPAPETAPALEVPSPVGDDELMVCGDIEARKSSTLLKMDEFDIVECNSKKVLATYDALENCWVKVKSNGLSITKIVRIPQRPGDWADFPYARRSIRWTDSHWKASDERIVFQAPKMPKELIRSLLARFERVKANGCSEDVLANDAEFAGLLMVAALNGSQPARGAFHQLGPLCHPDGVNAEIYSDFQKILGADPSAW